jgi:hypothetical protein
MPGVESASGQHSKMFVYHTFVVYRLKSRNFRARISATNQVWFSKKLDSAYEVCLNLSFDQ